MRVRESSLADGSDNGGGQRFFRRLEADIFRFKFLIKGGVGGAGITC